MYARPLTAERQTRADGQQTTGEFDRQQNEWGGRQLAADRSLEEADRLRTGVPVWWHAQPLLGCSLLVVGAATAAAFSSTLVRRFSEYALGSGIPHVEAPECGRKISRKKRSDEEGDCRSG